MADMSDNLDDFFDFEQLEQDSRLPRRHGLAANSH
jgi:hypothetical protein